MKTLEELRDETLARYFTPNQVISLDQLALTLRAAEQRGIERAAEWLLRDTQTDNRKEAAEAIRALAQGGEK